LVIVGEDCRSTVIDGGGDGPVVQISGSNVTFMNFTIRNGGSRSCVEISAFANFSSNRVLRSQIGVHMNARSIVMRNYISGCGQGILLYMCSSVRVESNILSGNTVGISLNEAHNNSILNNTVQESVEGGHGITILSKSFNNSILGNLIWNNSHGMWLSGDSQNNLIAENTISKNDILGIELTDAPNNVIYHNNFIDNKKQVTTNTINIWDCGYPSGGNYWSDYIEKYPEAKDECWGVAQNRLGSDGIWDTPYNIMGENVDHYPLVRPYGKIPDAKPPETMHNYDGEWHDREFVIQLTAKDDLSGVESTFYRINNGRIREVRIDGQPVICTEGANNTLEFWSVDTMGNIETHRFLSEIKLDKTPPVADAGQNVTVEAGKHVRISAKSSYDELSGIDRCEWDLGNETIQNGIEFVYNFSEPGTYKIVLVVYDKAGNLAKDTVFVTVKSPRENPMIFLPISAIIVLIALILTLIPKKLKRNRRKSRKFVKRRRSTNVDLKLVYIAMP